ncbi:AAA family ATPase [Dermabacter sp. HSID17554]|uniref:AAA family ATPase n=1 Tax=Dermabacter sp. HSID17554 TaxID=2419511 RepID=UPI001386F371|nr:SMC family ATPase [Dermabacter sp. HSID17554]
MKLHHLSFEGIGPFKDRVDLDFDALGASGLFLLEGATGSGKSTIIDAIVFALYGNVAGGGSSDARVRSDFMPNTRPSVVDLFFEVPRGIYRVRRTPAYERARLRGTGAPVHENQTAKLWKLSSPEALAEAIHGTERANDIEPIANRPQDVGAEVRELLGLTHAQFTQTVVLPQGEFARFLKADTSERKIVLERIFQTQFYEQIEQSFGELRREAQRDVDASKAELGATLERVLEAASASEDQRAQALADTRGFTPAGLERAREIGAELEEAAEEALGEATRMREMASVASNEAEEAAKDAAERHDLLVRKSQLDAHEKKRAGLDEAVREAREHLAGHERAEKPFYAHEQEKSAAEALHAAARELPEAEREESPQWEARGQEESERGESALRMAAALAGLEKEEAALPRREQEVKKAAQRAERAEAESQKKATLLKERPAEREKLIEKHREFSEQAAKLVALKEKREAHAARVRVAAEARISLDTYRTQTQRECDTLAELKRASEEESLLRRKRIDAIAFELAANLVQGEACPVCGACEHPAPAHTEDELVSQERIAQAEHARVTAEQCLSEARSAAAATKALHIDALERAWGESVNEDLVRFQEELPALIERLDNEGAALAREEHAAQEAEVEREHVSTEIAKFDERTSALEREAHESALTAERAAVDSQHLAKNLTETRQAIAAELKAHNATHETLAELRLSLLSVGEAARAHARLLDKCLEARGVHERAKTRLAEALAASGFDNVEEVVHARLSTERKHTYENTVREYSSLRAVIEEAKKDERLAQIEANASALEVATEALEVTQARVRVKRDEHTAAAGLHATRAKILERVKRARADFTARAAAHEKRSARQSEVLHLANVATGNSSDAKARLTLSTFAVMRRFEKVIEAANVRLGALSGGIYEIRLAHPEKIGRKQVGLDLEMVDLRHDSSRSPSTLSGGETFYVSLALALGLADIVSGENGGVQMNTLFIDEGFGTLDPEKLDGVIAEIRELAAHGRTVGIISHVAELKSQIAEKVHVERKSDGTSRISVSAQPTQLPQFS